MNERIKLLAEQAEWRFADKATGNFSEYDRRLEKFAQLIVQESIEVVKDSQGYNQYFPHVAENIKQHFGVE